MSVGKYSPTVSTSYSKDQDWWYKNGGGFGNGKNPDSDFDDDGFDSYGYDENDVDRASVAERSYMSTYSTDNYGDLHYYLYEEIEHEWAGIDILLQNKISIAVYQDPAMLPYLSQLSDIDKIQKEAEVLKQNIENKIKTKYPNFIFKAT